MRTWNLAVVCLAAFSLQSNAAIPIVNLKSSNQTAPKSQAINDSLSELAEHPELIDQMNLSDNERRELMQQIIINSEQKSQSEMQNEDEGLIHQVQLFNFPGFNGGGLFDFGQSRPAYPNVNGNPPQNQYDELDQNCPVDGKRARMPQPPAEPDVVFNAQDMANPADWKNRDFDLVVVINKAEYGQDMRVWRRLKPEDKVLTLIKDGRASGWKVSTGREHQEISRCDAIELGLPVSNHAPKSSYFSQTPTGYYIPDYLHIDHVSSDWEGSPMDHAVFFDSLRGIATHRVPYGADNLLGSRASGACVRMYQGQARELFWMVRATGGPITENELAQNDWGQCYKDGMTAEAKQACIARAKARRRTLNFRNEWELAKVSGFRTYDEMPTVPQITRDGKCRFPGADEKSTIVDDCSKPGALTRKGFRTLYVVENRYVSRPVRTRKKKAPAVSASRMKVKRATSASGSLGGLY
jgi:hypothetical protein